MKVVDKKLIAKILESPNAPKILERIQSVLEKEKMERVAFYDGISEQGKVEFINGEIIVHPAMKKNHNEITGNLYLTISTFVEEHQLGFVGIEKILIQLTRNDYEPDICFFKKEKSEQLQKEQSLFPAPDLVIEVLSKSTAKRDRGIKFEDYQNHEVMEYWIVDPQKKVIEQYRNIKGKYELVLKSKSGDIESIAIRNLIFPIKTVFDNQLTHQLVKQILTGK